MDKSLSSYKVCVLGGGSWGATIAAHLSKNGLQVALWEFVDAQVKVMRDTRSLPFLPQLKIPKTMLISSDMKEALAGTNVIFSVVPSEFVRSTWQKAKAFAGPVELAASLSKGIETGTLKRMTEVIADELPEAREKIAVVSGPSHAEEVARDIPTAVVAASDHKAVAELAQKLLTSHTFRGYTNPDVVGAEISGALKNIFAIACGACDGLGLGDNTKAALITRGLHEMAKVGMALGAAQVTFFGLAGMGDLIVTCTSQHSRNRLLGEKIGQGKKVKDALKEMTMVAEGYPNSKSAYQLLQKTKTDCPLITEIYRVLYEEKNIEKCLQDLLNRPIPAYGESRELSWKN